jgi:hypothetical protein
VIKRVLVAAGLGALGWGFVRTRRRERTERAAVGYTDGTSVVLERGAPELERMLQVALEVLPA